MKGHGQKGQSGLRSTKTKEFTSKPTAETNSNNKQAHPSFKRYDVFIKVFSAEEEGNATTFANQTGQFPKKSSKSNQYIMVLVHPDSNGIVLQKPMKNHTAGKMIRAYQCLIHQLKSAGITPKHHIMDNECLEEFKVTIKKNNMAYQLVPLHTHQRNLAEKAIQTFQAHFISILCGTDTNFPLHLWDWLQPQAEHTLNMLRRSTVTPTVSVYTYLWGQHDYNANPFAPVGCKVEAHIMPDVRKTWATHTASRYYIKNAWEHYRCHEVYISLTKCTHISEKGFFCHKYLTMPTIMPADALIMAEDNLVDAILGHLPKNSATADAVKQLMEIYKIQADQATCAARAQRVLREQTLAQRVAKEQQPVEPVQANHQHTSTTFPNFEVEDNQANDPRATSKLPVISQDEDSPPAANTRQQRQTQMLTQDYMFQMMKMPGY